MFQKEAYNFTTFNRWQSDLKYAEAQILLKESKKLEIKT